MDTRRQLKIASLIKEAFTSILNKEARGTFGKAFVTVTNVTVTSDLTLVRFYLSIYNAENPDEVVHRFNERKHEFKRHLSEALRHHLRRIPEIEFFRDDTLDYVHRMEEVFKKINEEDKAISATHDKENGNAKMARPRAKAKPSANRKSK